jgi:hypothetical protein
MPRVKKAPSNTVQSVVQAAQAAAQGDLEPPEHVRLRENDRPYWIAVVRARARQEWNEADLVNAGNMARAMADIERIQRELDEEGDILVNERGTQVVNPKHTLIEQLSRRIMALQRLLGMQAVTSGNARDKVKARSAEASARETVKALQDEDDLIPMN